MRILNREINLHNQFDKSISSQASDIYNIHDIHIVLKSILNYRWWWWNHFTTPHVNYFPCEYRKYLDIKSTPFHGLSTYIHQSLFKLKLYRFGRKQIYNTFIFINSHFWGYIYVDNEHNLYILTHMCIVYIEICIKCSCRFVRILINKTHPDRL